MLAIISPAKSLREDRVIEFASSQAPHFELEAYKLVHTLKKKSATEIQSLMDISDNLTELNMKRYRSFIRQHNKENSLPALSFFDGDVYKGLDVDSLESEDLEYLESHLRILSGLYGVLKPSDLMQPYRLEMGTKLETPDGKDLYEYWADAPTELINKDLGEDDCLINLASKEYSKVLKMKQINAKVIEPRFLDYHNGKYKIIALHAKKARGAMVRFMAIQKISKLSELLHFEFDGYKYCAEMSTENIPVFKRKR